jgi:hypothetical protein
MSTKLFVNLAVKDLKKSMDFFSKLGFTFNPQFTDENAACMVISEENYAMLIVPDFYRNFTSKEISDAKKSTEVIVSLTAESRKKVDEMMDKALRAGASLSEYSENLDWMYGRGFSDLDGHQWEFFWMDENAIPQREK